MAEETQTAYARSAFSDPINIVNFVALALVIPEVRAVIPPAFLPLIGAVVALANLYLSIFVRTHPVAFIPPNAVKPVEVRKLEATKQGTEDAEKLPPQLPSGEVPK